VPKVLRVKSLRVISIFISIYFLLILTLELQALQTLGTLGTFIMQIIIFDN